MDKDDEYRDVPLSESNVSLKLSEIQKRCSELLESEEGLELSLDDPYEKPQSGNPYDMG